MRVSSHGDDDLFLYDWVDRNCPSAIVSIDGEKSGEHIAA